MAPDLPPEAVEAARQATGRCLGLTHSPAELISLALVAAAPHIAAAERERLRSLLPYNHNCCDGFPAAVADLIGEHADD